jgi:hypothetical protein
MGLIFIEGVKVDGKELVDYAIPAAAKKIEKIGPSTIASVNVNAFKVEVSRKNLALDGDYGPLGPTMKKTLGFIENAGADSPSIDILGDFLALGDHGRFGAGAAIVGLQPDTLAEFRTILDSGNADTLQTFVDKRISGA